MTELAQLTDADREQQEAEAFAHVRDLRARKALGIIPDVIFHIRTLIEAAAGRSERGVEISVESTPLIAQWVDDSDELYANLVDWVGYWARQMETMPTATAAVAWRSFDDSHSSIGNVDNTVNGFKAGTTPAGARMLTRLQTMWLLGKNPQILLHPSASVYQDGITDIIYKLRSRYPTAPRPERLVSPRVCEVCGQPEMVAEWPEDGSQDVHDVVIHCGGDLGCGRVIETTPKEIAKWLSLDDPVKVRSQECVRLKHKACESVHCDCSCHDRTTRPARKEVER